MNCEDSKYAHNAGWAIANLISGILVFEWGFVAIQGGMQREAELSARALAGTLDAAKLGSALAAEWNSLWILLAVAAANVAFGIWRPRIFRIDDMFGDLLSTHSDLGN